MSSAEDILMLCPGESSDAEKSDTSGVSQSKVTLVFSIFLIAGVTNSEVKGRLVCDEKHGVRLSWQAELYF